MALINDPAFLDRDLGSTNGAVLRFPAEDPTITISCTGEIQVIYTNAAGEQQTDTYADLEAEDVTVAAAAASPIYLIGAVTLISTANQLQSVDLRALRTLTTLDLSGQTDIYSINLYGCRKLEDLNLSGCTELQQIDLKENVLLQQLNLSGCTGLQKLDLRTNTLLRVVDLTDCTGLSYLDATMLTKLEELQLDGTQLQSPGNTLLIARAAGGGGVPTGVAMEATSQEILQKVGTITAVDSDITYGKELLAAQITNKGVPASSGDSLVQMADKVRLISQNPVTVNTSDEYEDQLTADGSLWNLYVVRAALSGNQQIKNVYPCFILAEYFIGHDSISLQNASAYITSDNATLWQDEDGSWHVDVAQIEVGGTHVWHDDGTYANRWVCYLFEVIEQDYTIPTIELCPRSIHIGGHVGVITCPVAGRIYEIVCPDEIIDSVQTNSIKSLNFGSTNPYGRTLTLKNVLSHNAGYIIRNNGNVNSLLFECNEVTSPIIYVDSTNSLPISSITVKKATRIPSLLASNGSSYSIRPSVISLPDATYVGELGNFSSIGKISIPNVETMSFEFTAHNAKIEFPKLREIRAGSEGTLSLSLSQEVALFPELESIISGNRRSYFNTGSLVKQLLMPKLSKLSNGGIYGPGMNLPAVERLVLGVLTSFSVQQYTGTSGISAPNLLDIEVGQGTNISLHFLDLNPTNVIADSEKLATLNANIREHIAANVADRTGLSALTFTVSTNLYNNLEQATIDAFAAKNWNVAGA